MTQSGYALGKVKALVAREGGNQGLKSGPATSPPFSIQRWMLSKVAFSAHLTHKRFSRLLSDFKQILHARSRPPPSATHFVLGNFELRAIKCAFRGFVRHEQRQLERS